MLASIFCSYLVFVVTCNESVFPILYLIILVSNESYFREKLFILAIQLVIKYWIKKCNKNLAINRNSMYGYIQV